MGSLLTLSDVVASTYRAFPLIEIARLQSGVAGGQQTMALGAYDTKLDYYSLNQGVGFYENYRNGIGLARQTWWGGYASAGYRIGRGSFEPWYKERETNKGGEFYVGMVQPLLRGRAIDPQRVELFQANLQRRAVLPEIQNQVLDTSREAAYAYWSWLEAGNVVRANQRLLDIALERGNQLQKSYEQRVIPKLPILLNDQAISDRKLKVLESQRKFRDTAFKLALYLRDEAGNPMVAPPEWLPPSFPKLTTIPPGDFESDFYAAQSQRPELALIQITMQQLRWDLELARNQTLPEVDLTIQTSQDVGSPASSINDKGDYQLEAGVIGGVPLQRRKALGKRDNVAAKLQQTAQKRLMLLNKIEVELRTSRNALDVAQQSVDQSLELVRQSTESLEILRKAYATGNLDFLLLLPQEAKLTESEIKLLDAQRDFYIALASMQAALGLDPLEQSMLLNPTPNQN